MTHDDFPPKPPPRFVFPSGSLVGGDCSTAENLPECPNCGTIMIVVEGVAAHCPECCYKQKYPWMVLEEL